MAYNSNFLPGKFHLPLPTFSEELDSDVLRQDNLREHYLLDYSHYSIAMNQAAEKRSLVFAALNIDQNLIKQSKRQRQWYTEARIADKHQLNNDYYRRNAWDRGHQVRRANVSWGETQQEAQKASNDTFHYTNAALQHENLNQDEWLSLENWVLDLRLAQDGKITTFTGPFYGELSRSIHPRGRSLALIPAGFFKVVCFINQQSQKLDVRAFIMYQDDDALQDKFGNKRFNNRTYQSTIEEVERLTGLSFHKDIYHANPLYFHTASAEQAGLNVSTPERYEVAHARDLLAHETPRYPIKDTEIDVFIAGAMINLKGEDTNREWLVIINLSHMPIQLHGWFLENKMGQQINFDSILEAEERHLEPGESKRIKLDTRMPLSNNYDVIKLFNAESNRVDLVKYTKSEVDIDKPLWFLVPHNIQNT